MPFYKTIVQPDRGVVVFRRPQVIPPRTWVNMDGMRARLGQVFNFPGWESILSSGSLGGVGTLIDEFRLFSGNAFLLLGGPSKLFRWDPVSETLVDISGVLTFTPSLDDPWWGFSFADVFYFTNKNDGLYKWPGSGTVSAVGGSPPKARSADVLNDHLCLLNVNDGTDRPQRFQWAAEGTDNVWVAAATNDAGAFDLFETADAGQALYHLGNDLIVYKEHSIVPITFIGGNEVFGRRQAVAGAGLLGPYALAAVGDRHIFMGADTFYNYEGGTTADDSIGDAIREAIYPRLHATLRNRARALYLFESDEILFFYPDLNATNANNKCVIYNVKEGTWYGPFSIESTMAGRMFARRSSHPMALFSSLQGGVFQFGPLQSANGAEIVRELESGDHNLAIDAVTGGGTAINFPLNAIFMINAINIETDDIGPIESIEFYLGSREELNDTIVWNGPLTVSSSAGQVITLGARASGRWFRVRFVLRNSARLSLNGFQYVFNHVGNR